MIKPNLDLIKENLKFQQIGLTSRSCIGSCGCGSCSCMPGGCSCSCVNGRCGGRFQLNNFNDTIKTIYA